MKERVRIQLRSRFCFFAGTPEARRKTIQRTTAVRTPETANVPKTKAETQRITAAARRTAV